MSFFSIIFKALLSCDYFRTIKITSIILCRHIKHHWDWGPEVINQVQNEVFTISLSLFSYILNGKERFEPCTSTLKIPRYVISPIGHQSINSGLLKCQIVKYIWHLGPNYSSNWIAIPGTGQIFLAQCYSAISYVRSHCSAMPSKKNLF